MKQLIYVPIIHTSVDLGSLAKDVAKRGLADLGEEPWREHLKIVEGFWKAISNYFDSLDASGTKIYQDGMVAGEEMGAKIIEEGIKAGSKNHELISRLLKRGALLIKTEDFKLVKEERDHLLAITQVKSTSQKLFAFIKYKLVKDRLLNKRDNFVAQQIDETLKHGEKGILFIGAYHNIKERLPKSFLIIEIKSAEKIREYYKLLPFCHKHKEKLRELGQYLISPIS